MTKEKDDADIFKDMTLREYLQSFFKSANIFGWIWKEILCPESRKKIVQVLGFALIMTVLMGLTTLATKYMIDSLNKSDKVLVIVSILAFLLISWLSDLFSYLQSRVNEWFDFHVMSNLEKTITKKLFEKSLGLSLIHI